MSDRRLDRKASELRPAVAWQAGDELPALRGGTNILATLPLSTYDNAVARIKNVLSHGAVADCKQLTGGIIAAGTKILTAPSASFTSTDVGKLIQINGATGVGASPLSTTIASVNSSTSVTLADAATATTGVSYMIRPTPVTKNGTGVYVPGDELAIQGGTATSQAKALVVTTTTIGTPTIVSGGTGGITSSSVTFTGTTGTGTRIKFVASVSGGALTGPITVLNQGHYFTNPTDPSNEPVTGGNVTGAVISFAMGVDVVAVSTAGSYTSVPSNPASTGAGSISGATGCTVSILWGTNGDFVYGTDNSAAFSAAVNAMATSWSSGSPAYVYIPPGYYLCNSALPLISGYGGGFIGAGTQISRIWMGAGVSGALMSWSECWRNTPANGQMARRVANTSGPVAKWFAIDAFRTAPATQHGLVLDDRNDCATILEIEGNSINGSLLRIGKTRNTAFGGLRETQTITAIRAFECGNASSPVIEITAEGAVDGSNEIDLDDIDIYAPYGHGLHIHSNSTVNSVRQIKLSQIRIEGLQNNAARVSADLMRIGDPSDIGTVSNITANQVELINPYDGCAALRFTAGSLTLRPQSIEVAQLSIGGGAPLGVGVVVNAGSTITFGVASMSSYAANVIVSSSSMVVAPIGFYGPGNEQFWTYDIDSTSQTSVLTPVFRSGAPDQSGYFSIDAVDGTQNGGAQRGLSSVDLQQSRQAAFQIASGASSALLGGVNNTANGNHATVLGGFNNRADGQYSVVSGRQAAAQTRYGSMTHSSGVFSAAGDCQRSLSVLRATTTDGATSVRLTADAGSAGTTNIVNLANSSAMRVSIVVVGRDISSGDVGSWTVAAQFKRGANAAATSRLGAPAFAAEANNDAGTASWGGPTLNAADTTNGGISITVVGKAAATIHWVAEVVAVELQ